MSRVYGLLPYSMLTVVLLSACGRATPVMPSYPASVNGQIISEANLQRYVNYTLQFNAWAHHKPASAVPPCAASTRTGPCTRLRFQALGRLIEERVILDYAARHNIHLSVTDQARIDAELDNFQNTNSANGSPFRALGVDRSFLRSILERESLVQRVENSVAPAALTTGMAFHLRQFLIGEPSGGSGTAREQALALTIDGGPIPAGTQVRDEWVAPFRLARDIRSLVRAAGNGQYVGPFQRGHALLVIQVVGQGQHRYGKPARDAIIGRYFGRWLKGTLHAARLDCFTAHGRRTACPVP